jgi:hypothetical protein
MKAIIAKLRKVLLMKQPSSQLAIIFTLLVIIIGSVNLTMTAQIVDRPTPDEGNLFTSLQSEETPCTEAQPRIDVPENNGVVNTPVVFRFGIPFEADCDDFQILISYGSSLDDLSPPQQTVLTEQINGRVVVEATFTAIDILEGTVFWRTQFFQDGVRGPWTDVYQFTFEGDLADSACFESAPFPVAPADGITLSTPATFSFTVPPDVCVDAQVRIAYSTDPDGLPGVLHVDSEHIGDREILEESFSAESWEAGTTIFWQAQFWTSGQQTGAWSETRSFTVSGFNECLGQSPIAIEPEDGAEVPLPVSLNIGIPVAVDCSEAQLIVAYADSPDQLPNATKVRIEALGQAESFKFRFTPLGFEAGDEVFWRAQFFVKNGQSGPWSDPQSFVLVDLSEINPCLNLIPNILTPLEGIETALPAAFEFVMPQAGLCRDVRIEIAYSADPSRLPDAATRFTSNAIEDQSVLGFTFSPLGFQEDEVVHWQARYFIDSSFAGGWTEPNSFTVIEASGPPAPDQLPLFTAIAQLEEDDPIGPDADLIIGDFEIIRAIEFWIRDETVPGTNALIIDDARILALIALWISGELI